MPINKIDPAFAPYTGLRVDSCAPEDGVISAIQAGTQRIEYCSCASSREPARPGTLYDFQICGHRYTYMNGLHHVFTETTNRAGAAVWKLETSSERCSSVVLRHIIDGCQSGVELSNDSVNVVVTRLGHDLSIDVERPNFFGQLAPSERVIVIGSAPEQIDVKIDVIELLLEKTWLKDE
jgi:hypothetical protein